MSNSGDRQRQEEWRACLPRLSHIVQNVAPEAFNEAHERRLERIPDDWRQVMDALVAGVRANATDPTAHNAADPPVARHGYAWSRAVDRVGDCIEYLIREIRADIGIQEGVDTLATMVLVQRAMVHLQMELEDGGTEKGRDDAEEQTIRVYRAIRALNERFDDVGLRRVRALKAVEVCVPHSRIPTDDDVEERVERSRGLAVEDGRDFDEAAQRHWFRAELPMLHSLNSQSMLAAIDPAFSTLDPLIVLEELAEARSGLKGGKIEGGEGKTGPARALARLAVRCGALEYGQREDETFDDAVERARRNLHTTRSRLRDELRGFPRYETEE